jgi:hypothetical protein
MSAANPHPHGPMKRDSSFEVFSRASSCQVDQTYNSVRTLSMHKFINRKSGEKTFVADRMIRSAATGMLVGCFVFGNVACTKDYSEYRARASAQWVKDAVLYEIDLRSYSGQQAFRSVQSSIPELKRSGFTVLCLKPVFPTGEMNRPGGQGNPYATRDYLGVNPEFGSPAEFDSLVGAAHREGLKIIVDLAAGYAAWDSQIIMEHPEWFVHNEDGDLVSPDPSLPDVAGLNYDHHELRKYMIAVMEHWVRDAGVDGFRCIAAESVPMDFWSTARNELDKIKPVLMISDGTLPASHVKAFDLTYSRNIREIFEKIEHDSLPAKKMADLVDAEISRYPAGSLLLRCDAECGNESAPGTTNIAQAAGAAVCVFTFPGVPLLCSIRQEGDSIPPEHPERGGPLWKDPALTDLYNRLVTFRIHHSAVRDGKLVWLPTSDSAGVCAFARIDASDSVLVVVNLSKHSKKVITDIPAGASPLWRDTFGGHAIGSVDNELTIHLSPFGYGLFYPTTEEGIR